MLRDLEEELDDRNDDREKLEREELKPLASASPEYITVGAPIPTTRADTANVINILLNIFLSPIIRRCTSIELLSILVKQGFSVYPS